MFCLHHDLQRMDKEPSSNLSIPCRAIELALEYLFDRFVIVEVLQNYKYIVDKG